MGLLLLATPKDTCEDLVQHLLRMAKTRVKPSGRYTLYFRGKSQSNHETVTSLGLSPLDRIDVRQDGA